jgi:hypothetical protein
MHGVISPLLLTFPWCGAWLGKRYVFMAWYLVKHRDIFTLSVSIMTTNHLEPMGGGWRQDHLHKRLVF